jgi:hypothetical protein
VKCYINGQLEGTSLFGTGQTGQASNPKRNHWDKQRIVKFKKEGRVWSDFFS